MRNTALQPTSQTPSFLLADLDEPIAPATPATSGVQVIAVGIVLLIFLPVAVDTNRA